MKTSTKSATLGATIAALSTLATTTHACSILPPQAGCHLTSLRATNDPYIVQGTIDRVEKEKDDFAVLAESRQVFIDLRSESILSEEDDTTTTPTNNDGRNGEGRRQRRRGLRRGGTPTHETPNLEDIEIAPYPVPQDASDFTVEALGSTVTVTNQLTGEEYTFELTEATYNPEKGDTLSFFYDQELDAVWVFYANNRSYWGGVQVTRVIFGEDPVRSYTLSRETWNESGDAWWWVDGEIPYYPDLKLATLQNSGALCGGTFALYNRGYSLEHYPNIRNPLLSSFSRTPVYYAQDDDEDSAIFILGGDSNAAVIEKVSIPTGEITDAFHICQYNIDMAGGCPVPANVNPRATGSNGCPKY